MFEDINFFSACSEDASDNRTPRKQYVVTFQYTGEDSEKSSREYISKQLLGGDNGVPLKEVQAVMQLQRFKKSRCMGGV